MYVFVCHGLSGFIGVILTGVFASSAINQSIENGAIYVHFSLLIKQSIGAIVIALFAMLTTFVIVFIMQKFISIRVSELEEQIGLGLVEHKETAHSTQGLNQMQKKYLSRHITRMKQTEQWRRRKHFSK